MESQNLAKRALLGKKNWKRPGKGLSHEANSQLMRVKNAYQAALAGLGSRLDMLEKEELKKQIDSVSMKVSQQYSVVNPGEMDQRLQPNHPPTASTQYPPSYRSQQQAVDPADDSASAAAPYPTTNPSKPATPQSPVPPSQFIRGMAAAGEDSQRREGVGLQEKAAT